MSEESKLRPITIKVDDDLLEKLVKMGVEELMGFKLCRLFNEYDMDIGEKDISIRVCGGPMCIHCECEDKPEAIQLDDVLPILINDLHREDEF